MTKDNYKQYLENTINKEAAGPTTDYIGSTTGTLLGAGAGATLGGALGGAMGGGPGAAGGALTGYTLGAVAPTLVAMALAATKPTLSEEEMKEMNEESAAKPLLVPGKGTYNLFKRLGYSGTVK